MEVDNLDVCDDTIVEVVLPIHVATSAITILHNRGMMHNNQESGNLVKDLAKGNDFNYIVNII